MKVELRSDVGKMREHNEDVCDYFLSDDLLLAVVADGMGGHKAGDVASELAIQTLREAWKKQAPHATEEAMTSWLLHTITEANERIYEQSLTNTEMRGMGTTIVCALITESEMISAHVGDSRLYVKKKNTISHK
ncbi:protein phosphatase 2C domain-containing protein [Geomicrobium sp. JCM 19055]|uniref:protein phosphatase 2C domain-containing protein n=1 Tax=Geomicrobium sp. JCM 19055 TaxID=1460649 RepID=UPI000694B936|nr:protein phosphatase 2C domain-containing protein [Geomicrobium sp. JCM 19055]